jgi:hypothetical protein
MSSLRAQFVPLLIVVGLSGLSLKSRSQNAQAEQPQAAEQSPDSISLPLAQLPPGPVIVNYQQGQLMVEAQNATLSTVLRAVCNQTGTAIDIPSDADERVVGRFGPGLARDVFALLLNGSRFNYVMLGSNDDARRIVRLTLSVKPAGPLNDQPVRPTPQVVAKRAESPPAPQSPEKAAQPSTESNAAAQSAPQLPRRRYRRR